MKFEQLTRFARGFVYAYNGIRAAVQEERNFRFHLCAAFYAFAAAFWAELDRTLRGGGVGAGACQLRD